MRLISSKWLYTFLIIGIVLLLGGILLWVDKSANAESVIAKIWPVVGFALGGYIMGRGFWKRRRLVISYVLPAVSIIILCCVFLPFSLGIATISFIDFVIRILPVLMLLGGAALVLLFVAQTRNKNLVLPDENVDDDDILSD